MLSLTCRNLCANVAVVAKRPPTLTNLSLRKFANESFSSARAKNTAKGAGATLKEFLRKEATDTPYAYGRMAVIGASAAGIGALCFYGLGLSKETGAIDEAAFWPEYVRERINKTYGYLAAGLGVTSGAAVAVFRSPAMMNLMTKNSLLALFGTFAAMMGTGIVARSIPYTSDKKPLKLMAWMAHCGVMGAIIAPLGLVGGPLILRAALYTAGIVGGLSTIAACAPSDKFLNMGGALGIGLGVVFAASLGTWFLPPTSMMGAGVYSIALYGGLVLFAGFMLYDTQRMIKIAKNHPSDLHARHYSGISPYDPINAQMSIYMNTLNIFIRMVMILSGVGGNRRK